MNIRRRLGSSFQKSNSYMDSLSTTLKIYILLAANIMDTVQFADIDLFSASNRSRNKTCSKCKSAEHTILISLFTIITINFLWLLANYFIRTSK